MEGELLDDLDPLRRSPGETKLAFFLLGAQDQLLGIYFIGGVGGKGKVSLLNFQAEGKLLAQLPFGQIQGLGALLDLVEVSFDLPGFEAHPASVENSGVKRRVDDDIFARLGF